MMKIDRVLFAPGKAGFYFDDQRAIREGDAVPDGLLYQGRPMTPGFTRIREPGECISVLLVLDDGRVAQGDCAAVQYSGVGGRDPLFVARTYLPFLRRRIAPRLAGRAVEPFRAMAEWMEALRIRGRPLHTAIRYGLSQALLEARALALGCMPCEVLAAEYDLPLTARRVPVFGQTGDHRQENVDKMILKEADVVPHGLVNRVEGKLGRRGEKLRAYVRWLAQRIRDRRARPDYRPVFHFDVYGTIGLAFNHDPARMADYLARLEQDAGEFPLYIEGPVDMGAQALQMEMLGRLREALRVRGARVRIVADEWCNTLEDVRRFADEQVCDMIQIKTPDLGGIQRTVEAVRYCRSRGMEAYQGGTCNETDLSARACVHVAMAARPHRMLAKPGMGFDEGFMVVNNEMERILVRLRAQRKAGSRKRGRM